MAKSITRSFLEGRHWAATALIVLSLILAAQIGWAELRGVQHDQRTYAAVYRLMEATKRVQTTVAFARLTATDTAYLDRRQMTRALRDVAEATLALQTQQAGENGSVNSASQLDWSALATTLEIDAGRVLGEYDLAPGTMPSWLGAHWVGGPPRFVQRSAGAASQAEALGLNTAVERLIGVLLPVLRAERVRVGDLDAAISVIGGLNATALQPRFSAISGEIAARSRDSAALAQNVLLLSLGFAGFVAVLAAVVIFRPMAAAILRQQSDLIQERDKALRSEQVKRDFLAVMSHELRTPMNGVMGFAKLLSDTDLDEKQRDYVRTIHSSGEGLLEMLNDILDLSKVEAGSLELQRDLVSIDESIHAVVGLMSAKAREKRLALSTFVDPRLPEEVLTDSTCLRKLLLNLVGNAIKFTDAGAVGVEVLREDTVDLSAATGDEQTERVWVRIAVHDTGIGIPKDKLDHIFGRFTQADSSLKRRYDGTGLGLAICQEISELMGGSISVESVEGQGSVFTLRLPLDMPGPEHCAGEPVPEIGEAIGVSLTGVRALVVEPRSVCRRLLTAQLDAYGAETVAVGDAFGAEEARKQAAERDRPFDIVFIDPELPAAPELCKTWRRGEAGRWGARTRRGAGPSPRAAFPVVALVSAIGPRTPVGAGSTDVEAGAFADATLSREATAGTLVQLVKKATRAIPCNTAEPALLDPGAELFAAPDARVSVLVVDDNPTNQKLVAAQLIGQGIEVVGVENGAQALDRLRHRAPSLILMDLRMPVMDGLEATRRIRAMDAPLADLPIIAMTANAMHGDRETCLAAGMDDYLSKPLDLEVLVEKVNHHLSSKADAGTPSCGPEEDTRSQTV